MGPEYKIKLTREQHNKNMNTSLSAEEFEIMMDKAQSVVNLFQAITGKQGQEPTDEDYEMYIRVMQKLEMDEHGKENN